MARSGHQIQRREAARHSATKPSVAYVQRFENAHTRLNGTATVGRGRAAHMAVGADQPGHQHAPRGIHPLSTLRYCHHVVRAHRKAATGKVQDLIKECQRARFEKFVLRAKEKAKF